MVRTAAYPKGGISVTNVPTTSGTWFIPPMGNNDYVTQNQKDKVDWYAATDGWMGDLECFIDTDPGSAGAYWEIRLMNLTTGENIQIRIENGETSKLSRRNMWVNQDDRVQMGLTASTGTAPASIGKFEHCLNWKPAVSTEDTHTSFTPGAVDNTVTVYLSPELGGKGGWGTTTTEQTVVSNSATLGNFRIHRQQDNSPPGAGNSFAHSMVKNPDGTPEKVTITLDESNMTANAGSSTMSIVAGDTLIRECIPTSTPVTGRDNMVYTLDTGTSGQGHFFGGGDDTLSTSATEYNFINMTGGLWNSTEANRVLRFASAKRITDINILLSGTPTGTYTFTLMLDGVAQGSTDIAITTTGTTASLSGLTLDVEAGETLSMRCVPTGSPTARTVSYAMLFEDQPAAADLPTAVNWGHVDHPADTSARFTAELGDVETDAQIVVSVDSGLASEDFLSASTATTSMNFDGIGLLPILQVEVTGLTANTQYYWGVKADSTTDTSYIGAFKTPDTANTAPAATRTYNWIQVNDVDYTFIGGTGSASGEVPVFTQIADNEDPFIIDFGGDWVYQDVDPAVNPITDVSVFRSRFRSTMVLGDTVRLLKMCWWASQLDDHDLGYDAGTEGAPLDNSVRQSMYLLAKQAYSELMPHIGAFAVTGTGAWTDPYVQRAEIGRITMLVTDQMSYRSVDDVKFFGDGTSYGTPSVQTWDQMAWIEQQMLLSQTNGAKMIIHPGGTSIEDTSEGWGIATSERSAFFNYAVNNNVPEMVMIHGDSHRFFADDGTLTNSYMTGAATGYIVDFSCAPGKFTVTTGPATPKPWFAVDTDTTSTGGGLNQQIYGKLVLTDNPANYFITYTYQGIEADGTVVNTTTYSNLDTPTSTAITSRADLNPVLDDVGTEDFIFDRGHFLGPAKIDFDTESPGGGTAVAVTDYTALTSSTQTSSGNGPFLVPLTIVNRTGTNGSRTVIVTIDSPDARCTVGADANQQFTLTDGVDAIPTPSLTQIGSVTIT